MWGHRRYTFCTCFLKHLSPLGYSCPEQAGPTLHPRAQLPRPGLQQAHGSAAFSSYEVAGSAPESAPGQGLPAPRPHGPVRRRPAGSRASQPTRSGSQPTRSGSGTHSCEYVPWRAGSWPEAGCRSSTGGSSSGSRCCRGCEAPLPRGKPAPTSATAAPWGRAPSAGRGRHRHRSRSRARCLREGTGRKAGLKSAPRGVMKQKSPTGTLLVHLPRCGVEG